MKRHTTLHEEMWFETHRLPRCINGLDIDYTDAPVAYVASVTLLYHGNLRHAQPTRFPIVTPDSEVLIVERAKGQDNAGKYSAVSGYVDTLIGQTGDIIEPDFYTARKKLTEECQLSPYVLEGIQLYRGWRFTERNAGRLLHRLPVLGLCRNDRPIIRPNGYDITNYAWVPLGALARQEKLSTNYLEYTLPRALSALALAPDDCHRLTGIRPA
jgi:hypothetical protein